MRANTATISDSKTSIYAYYDKSTFVHPFAKEFVFPYKNNKYIFSLSGSEPRPFFGLGTWKFLDFLRAPLASFYSLGAMRDNISKNPIIYYRHKILPFDESPFSNIFNQFGLLASVDTLYLSTLLLNTDIFDVLYYYNQDLFFALNEYLYSKNLTLEDFAIQKQFTIYEELRLYFEKVIPIINDDLTISIARRDSRIKNFKATIYKKDENSGFFEEIATFDAKNIGRDAKILGISGKLKRPSKEYIFESCFLKISKNSKNYIANKTSSYYLIEDGIRELIVKPYGIVEVYSEDINVYKLPYLYCEVTSLNENTEYNRLFDEFEPTHISGYNIKSPNYYINKHLYHLPSKGGTIQIGPVLIHNIPKKPEIYDTFIRLPEMNFKKLDSKETIVKAIDIRYVNKEIYYKDHNETDFKKAFIKNGKYVIFDEYILGDEAFKVFEDYLEHKEDFIYQRDFLQKDNTLYTMLGKALNPRGIAIYEDKYFKDRLPNICIDNIYLNRANTIEFNPYDLVEVKTDEFGFFAKSDVDGETKYYDLRVIDIPGLRAKNKMLVLGGGILEGEFPVFKNLRSANGRAKFLYYIVKTKNTKKTILFPVSDYTDTFIDVDRETYGQCFNPKKKGSYDLNRPKDLYPQLIYAIGDNENSLEIKTTDLADYRPYPVGIISSIKEPEPIVDEIVPLFFFHSNYSSAYEYLNEPISTSYIANKKFAIIKEVGLILDITDLEVSEPFKITKEIVEKNQRGLELRANDIRVEIRVSGEYKETKTLEVKVYKKDSLIDTLSNTYIPFYDYTKGFKPLMKRSSDIIVGFVYEAFINEMARRKRYQKTLIDIDESNGVIDERDVVFSLEDASEGRKIIAELNNGKVDIINYPGVLNCIYFSEPYIISGDLNVVIASKFIFKALRTDDNNSIYEELINQANSNEYSIYYNYDIFSPNNVFKGLKVFYDGRLLALGPKDITLPRGHRALMRIFLGEGNIFTSTNDITSMDDIYAQINGVVIKNSCSEDSYRVIYYKLIDDIALLRDLKVDLKEQTFMFSSYYNNAKAQLIQDLREDTVQKRIDGAYIDAQFDTDHIYNTIHTIKEKLYNLPVSFRCSNIPDEAKLNYLRIAPKVSNVISYEELFNAQGSIEIAIEKSAIISLKNSILELHGVSYDVKDIALRLANKEILYNDTNIKSYTYNENIKRKDVR